MVNYPINLRFNNIQPNPQTSFNPRSTNPYVHHSAVVHHNASIIGPVVLGEKVFVAPTAVIRADEGSPMYVGNNSNIQDGVVIHGIKNKPGEKYSVIIGDNTSIAHQSLIHGPAIIGNNTFVGFQSMVYNANIGNDCVLEFGSKVVDCTVPDGHYVPAFQIIDTQEEANNLPMITSEYKLSQFNKKVLEVNKELVQGYKNYYMGNYMIPQVNPQMLPYPTPMPVFKAKKSILA